jgi:hypothetical protein
MRDSNFAGLFTLNKRLNKIRARALTEESGKRKKKIRGKDWIMEKKYAWGTKPG